MLPEANDSEAVEVYAPDLFAEPRDHVNQWDISALWPEPAQESRQGDKEPKSE